MTSNHTNTNLPYVPCREQDIPDAVRFDVPRRLQGQMIEVAYGGFGRDEHCDGDPYMRVIDRSIGPDPKYHRRSDVRA